MHEDHSRAPLQLVEQRPESGIAEINAACVGKQHDPIELEYVETIFERSQCTIDVGQWQCRKPAETIRALLDELRRYFIHSAGEIAGSRIITHVHARCADRSDRPID